MVPVESVNLVPGQQGRPLGKAGPSEAHQLWVLVQVALKATGQIKDGKPAMAHIRRRPVGGSELWQSRRLWMGGSVNFQGIPYTVHTSRGLQTAGRPTWPSRMLVTHQCREQIHPVLGYLCEMPLPPAGESELATGISGPRLSCPTSLWPPECLSFTSGAQSRLMTS